MTTTLDQALSLASRGFHLFPLGESSKVPACAGWQDMATRDPAILTDWFGKHPYNVGIYTGKYGDNRALCVIDVDVKGDKRGDITLADLGGAGGTDIPATLRHTTPTGGQHIIYACDEPLKQGVEVLGSGLDIRSRGGYIVAPGSVLDGKPYETKPGPQMPTPAPAWLVERLGVARGDRSQADHTPMPGIVRETALARAKEWLLKHAPLAIQNEGGDSSTFKVAAQVKDYGCGQDDTLDLMLEFWNERCSPPWDLDELTTKIANAFKHGENRQGADAPEVAFDVVPEATTAATAPAKAKVKASALEVLRCSDFLDKPVPPVRWLWEPYFPAVPFGILASHPGHGKSYLALQIAVAVATGLPLFGRPATTPAGAGILGLEDGQDVFHRRLKAIVAGYGTAWTPAHSELLDLNLRLIVRGTGTTEAHDLEKLLPELMTAMRSTQAPPAVLFLDTLNAIYGGDEKDNTSFRDLAATIFSMHAALGCSIYALHHLKKAGTGRNGPSLTDRLDPEMVRGASAIAGSARAMVQFAGIKPDEAEKVGLEPENSPRRYAILSLTKANNVPLSPWLLLEHAQDPALAGLWTQEPNGERILANLRGGGAVHDLDKAEAILVDIHDGMDRTALTAKHYPGDAKGADKLKRNLSAMRGRHQWLKPRTTDLTDLGRRKAEELKGFQGLQVEDVVDPDAINF